MKHTLIAAGVLAAAASATILPTGAEAKIRCDGPWQIVQGNKIATPYCGDNYLAQVARRYGSKVSARAIRQNPSTKREICQWIGHDPEVQDICAGLRSDDGGRGGFR
ncbi:MAG: hypothetical protein APF80_12550 [Alphaproteobacteria bacterium BRH_c36]|nr:MAG: hypothetical protein APF80_12550 [Alphaproteobacteria bacterium BRH_c36]